MFSYKQIHIWLFSKVIMEKNESYCFLLRSLKHHDIEDLLSESITKKVKIGGLLFWIFEQVVLP